MSPQIIMVSSRFLNVLQSRLLLSGLNLEQFGLPLPVNLPTTSQADAFVKREQEAYDVRIEAAKAREKLGKLNIKQRQLFDNVMTSLSNANGDLFFVDAPGGTGKTFLINTILNAVRADGHIAVATALSAVASKLLEGGTTLHSRLKVPIDIKKDSLCSFTNLCGTGKVFILASLLIIDETCMGHRHIFEAIDRSVNLTDRNLQIFAGQDTSHSERCGQALWWNHCHLLW